MNFNNKTFSIVIISLLSAFLFFFYFNYQINDLSNKENEISNDDLQVLMLKSEADESFFNKEYDNAFEKYQQVVLLNGDSSLISQREAIKDEIEGYATKKDVIIRLLRNCPEFVLKYGKANLDQVENHILLNYTVTCFQNLQKISYHVVQEAENKITKKVLEFESIKGDKVRYLGEVTDEKAHGIGIGLWDTGGVYEGEWFNNYRHGKGTHQAKNGEHYEGDWEEDQRTGKGVFTFRNGDYYTGEWAKNKRNGFGTVISAKGDTLVHGFWKDDSYDRRKTRELSKILADSLQQARVN